MALKLIEGNLEFIFGEGTKPGAIGTSIIGVDITNVAQWYYVDNPKMDWTMNDLPVSSPPWNRSWFEWNLPKTWNMDGELATFKYNNVRMGAYQRATRITDANRDKFFEQFQNRFPVEDAEFFVEESLYQFMRGELFHICDMNYGVTSTGDMLVPMQVKAGRSNLKESAKQLHKATDLLWPLHVAISFLHCKNVELADNVAPPKVLRKRQKSGKPSFIFKTLAIGSLKKESTTATLPGNSPMQRALHICRGHWKDFTEKGLFGKHKGIFFWEQRLRGTSKEGVVVKDYKVNSPKEG